MQSVQLPRRNSRNRFTLLFCFAMAFLLQGCISLTCKDCGETCPDGTTTTLKCPDGSMPNKENKCANGTDPVRTQACVAVAKPCGWGCSRFQEGKTGCDVNHSTYKCTTVYSGSACVDCQCLP